jgi:hypothetical protein
MRGIRKLIAGIDKMKIKSMLFGCLVLVAGPTYAGHHEEKTAEALPMALWSTYSIPAGGSISAIKSSLVEYLKSEEEAGFDNCVMYQHQFGSQRGFYTSCTFKNLDHFAKMADQDAPASPADDIQLFGDHTDHIVNMTSMGMKALPKHILFSTTTFSPSMTYAEMSESADTFYGVYEEAFGACNRYDHGWGPEMAFYITCGFESYAEFSKAVGRLMPIFEAKLYNANLGIRTHSDDLLIKVMD